jgi:hypothetical protein
MTQKVDEKPLGCVILSPFAVILSPSSVILSVAKDPFQLTQDKLREGSRYFAQGTLREESQSLWNQANTEILPSFHSGQPAAPQDDSPMSFSSTSRKSRCPTACRRVVMLILLETTEPKQCSRFSMP